MTNKEIFAKVHTILELAMEISTSTEADVFMHYQPHISWVEVNIHRHGWKSYVPHDKEYICKLNYPDGCRVNERTYYPSLDEVIAELEVLKEQAEKLPESEVKPDELS